MPNVYIVSRTFWLNTSYRGGIAHHENPKRTLPYFVVYKKAKSLNATTPFTTFAIYIYIFPWRIYFERHTGAIRLCAPSHNLNRSRLFRSATFTRGAHHHPSIRKSRLPGAAMGAKKFIRAVCERTWPSSEHLRVAPNFRYILK